MREALGTSMDAILPRLAVVINQPKLDHRRVLRIFGVLAEPRNRTRVARQHASNITKQSLIFWNTRLGECEVAPEPIDTGRLLKSLRVEIVEEPPPGVRALLIGGEFDVHHPPSCRGKEVWIVRPHTLSKHRQLAVKDARFGEAARMQPMANRLGHVATDPKAISDMLVFERARIGAHQLKALVQPTLAKRECFVSTKLHQSSDQATAALPRCETALSSGPSVRSTS